MEEFERTEQLLGSLEQLNNAHIAVFGVGGVGGYVVEALVRSGVGEITVVDKDVVSLSNINRQIIALHSTVGMPKVEAIKARALDINPNVVIHTYEMFFLPETASAFDFSKFDYVVDCVDTVTAKVEIAVKARDAGVPVISAMGAGNKLDPTRFEVDDIFNTSVCPLCRVMRKELKNRGVESLKVVYSKEEPISTEGVGSVAFVPSVMGLIIAGEVIKWLKKKI
ncbi:MAG: tRNA threonylcarbamoyladenosine dehydratase [Oscillospiraceae bacterium]|nr:tRNA threonylcarbamoyladenosine dehydratase [Candidatus Limimonas egerieequi]